MSNYAICIKSKEEPGVLEKITDVISHHNINIVYLYLFIENNSKGNINLELENVDDINDLINDLKTLDSVKSIETYAAQEDVFGKRIIIYGGGAQVSQVALGAITEADRHNIRGERISVDTLPVVGEDNIAEAINELSRLPRVSVLVLAGSLMGGRIVDEILKIKKQKNLTVISLNMPGGVTDVADLVVTDPIQAGVMAVMQIADTAVFDYNILNKNHRNF